MTGHEDVETKHVADCTSQQLKLPLGGLAQVD
jgi:hypothetical protein